MLGTVVVFFPFFLYLSIRDAQANGTLKSPSFKAKFGGLVGAFTANFAHWRLIIIAKKLLIALAASGVITVRHMILYKQLFNPRLLC